MDTKQYALINNWDIGTILDFSPVLQGTSCRTYTVQTSQGKYILRGFDSHQQAEQESKVFRVLQGTKIGAELVYTKCGNAYLSANGKYYNLQTFLHGKKANLADEHQVRAAAQSVSKLHKALRQCTLSTYSRFSTDALLQQSSELDLPAQLFPKETATTEQRQRFVRDLEQEFFQCQAIHADLGDWNMLWNGNALQIIDFGECRAGDIYCDLAAVICSILEKCSTKEIFTHLMTVFLKVYQENGTEIHNKKLDKAVYIWLLRGILASSINIHDASKRDRICKHFMYEIMKYESYREISLFDRF